MSKKLQTNANCNVHEINRLGWSGPDVREVSVKTRVVPIQIEIHA
jgi:hypothetical protein